MKGRQAAPWLVSALLAGALPLGADGGPRVGPGVVEALRRSGRAQVVVAFRDPGPAGLPERIASIAALRGDILAGLRPGDLEVAYAWETVPGLSGRLSAAGLARLLADPDVTQVDLDPTAVAHMAEAVPMVHADEVQALGFTGAGVTVAVLDTGIDTDHPDFAGRIVDQACFCTNAAGGGCCPGGAAQATGAGSAEDDNGHGTNVAGVIAGGGVAAPRGMAPSATLVAIKVLDAGGAGSSSGIVAGLDYVVKSRPDVRIVNISLGLGNLFAGTCDSAASFTTGFASAINALRSRGTIVFASSGNQGNASQIAVPACIANAVAVGAVYDDNVGTVTFGCTDSSTGQDRVACFSNASSALDLLAPGAAITASGLGGGSVTFLGTSQACPSAAGVAALLLSASPGASPDKVESALKGTGVSVTDSRNGQTFRRVSARSALDSVR